MTPDESIRRREEIRSALRPLMEEIRKSHETLSKQVKPVIAGPQAETVADVKSLKTQIARPPSGFPVAQSLGSAAQPAPPQPPQTIPTAIPFATPIATPFATPFATPIAGPAPKVAKPTYLAGRSPIAGPPSNLSGTTPTFGASSSPVTASGSPIAGGKGVAGSMGLGSQSGSLLSGGGAGTGGGQQDLLSAITELIEAIKDLTEKLGDDDDKKKAHTPKTGKGEQASRQQGGKDLISQAAQNAPGIEWANQMERWFASRFGRGNFGSG